MNRTQHYSLLKAMEIDKNNLLKYQELYKYAYILSDGIFKKNQVHTSEKYELPRIYFLGLLDFELFPEEPQKYIHHVDEMCNGRKFFPKIQKIFVEIDKFFELEKAGITKDDNSWPSKKSLFPK